MHKKSILIIIIVIVFLAFVAGVFWKWEKVKKIEETERIEEQKIAEQKKQEEQKQDDDQAEIDTSDWKTYRNDEYGFEFKYPISKNVYSSNDSGSEYSIATKKDNNSFVKGKQDGNFIFGIRYLGDQTLSEDFIKDQFGNENKNDIEAIPFVVAGRKGFKVKFKKEDKFIISEFYYINNLNDQILSITVALNDNIAKKIFYSLNLD